MDTEVFLGCACELLAIPSTSERPAELRRALDYVLDFTGPGFTVERFESGGKPSALVYPGTGTPGISTSSSTPTWTSSRLRRTSSARAATETACSPAAPRT
jgi:hypothetical protein